MGRKLEKMRQNGELKRVEKSAVDRSSEAVASKLLQPRQTIDAMDELRSAGNQVELERLQRKLARVKRLEDKHSVMAHKVLDNTPQWIKDEALAQEVWIAEKKAEKMQKQGDKVAEPVAQIAKESCSSQDEPIVECASCTMHFPWSELVAGDGYCSKCFQEHLPESKSSFETTERIPYDTNGAEHPAGETADELIVECASCAAPTV